MIPVPHEIWQQIFAHFESVLPEDEWWTDQVRTDCDSKETLTSMCLVSRQFCRVAQPLLFRTIVLPNGQANKELRQHQYTVLIRALATCPELGFETRTITLRDSVLPITPGLQSILQDLLPSLDLPPAIRRQMERELELCNKNSNSDKFIDIKLFLLVLMPRIRLVDLKFDDVEAPVWMLGGRADAHRQVWGPWSSLETLDEAIEDSRSDVVRVAGSQDLSRACFAKFGLPNLEELRIRMDYDEHGINFNFFEEFKAVLLHPNLKTFRLQRVDWRIDWVGDPMYTMNWPDEPCGIQSLELRECMINESGLRHILTRFTDLRSLMIHVRESPRQFDPASWVVHLHEFGATLSDLGQNLVDLSLDIAAYFEHGRVVGRLGSLREMRSLKHLSLVLDDLIDDLGDQPDGILSIADFLPLSIETVLLHCEEQSWEGFGRGCDYVGEAVRKLLELGHMPSLRQVSIKGLYTREELEGELDEPVTGWDTTVEGDSWTTFDVTFTKRD